MHAYAKPIVYSVVLSGIGFLSAVGLMTVLAAPTTSAFAPVNSADAAGWVQAVGSVAAIVAAYMIGAKQARDARDSAFELYRIDKKRIEEGCRAIVSQMHIEVGFIDYASTQLTVPDFRDAWFNHLRAAAQMALQAFDSMPIHELGGSDAVRHAFEIRSQFAQLVGFLDRELAALNWPTNEEIPADKREEFQKLREIIQRALHHGITSARVPTDQLYAQFAATFKA